MDIEGNIAVVENIDEGKLDTQESVLRLVDIVQVSEPMLVDIVQVSEPMLFDIVQVSVPELFDIVQVIALVLSMPQFEGSLAPSMSLSY